MWNALVTHAPIIVLRRNTRCDRIILTLPMAPFPIPGQKTRTLISLYCSATLEQHTLTIRWGRMKTWLNTPTSTGKRCPERRSNRFGLRSDSSREGGNWVSESRAGLQTWNKNRPQEESASRNVPNLLDLLDKLGWAKKNPPSRVQNA